MLPNSSFLNIVLSRSFQASLSRVQFLRHAVSMGHSFPSSTGIVLFLTESAHAPPGSLAWNVQFSTLAWPGLFLLGIFMFHSAFCFVSACRGNYEIEKVISRTAALWNFCLAQQEFLLAKSKYNHGRKKRTKQVALPRGYECGSGDSSHGRSGMVVCYDVM